MCWVYSFRQKSDVADVLKRFKSLVKNQTSFRIKVFKSDNGNEYTTEKFVSLCEEDGIQHQLTFPLHSSIKWSERKEKPYYHGDGKMLVD